jgi:uncharacterized membrane protein YgdD (TMEM256/DUF423 family)
MQTAFVVFAAVLGFVGVALGAFGAHGLASHFRAHPHHQDTFKTAVQYQMYHALALLGVALAQNVYHSDLLLWAGYLFVLGVVLFSGSLYVLVLTDQRWLGAITPIGGLAFLGGWLCLMFGALQGK